MESTGNPAVDGGAPGGALNDDFGFYAPPPPEPTPSARSMPRPEFATSPLGPEHRPPAAPFPLEPVVGAGAPMASATPALAEPAAGAVDSVPVAAVGLAPAAAPPTDLSPEVLRAMEAAQLDGPPAEPSVAVGLHDAEEGEVGFARVSTEDVAQENDIVLQDLLMEMVGRGASDLHLTSGTRPMIRFNGGLYPIEEAPELTPPVIQRVLYAAMTQQQRERFEEALELDFAYSVPGRARFRVNVYRQRDSLGAAFRLIPYEIKPLESLGIPPSVSNFAMLPRGFVLVTGPTGSGKTTTLAAMKSTWRSATPATASSRSRTRSSTLHNNKRP